MLTGAEHHGKHSVRAADRHEINGLLLAENLSQALERCVADFVLHRKFHAKIVDGSFVRLHGCGPLALLQIGRDRLRQPRLKRKRVMRMLFDLRSPKTRLNQDGKLV